MRFLTADVRRYIYQIAIVLGPLAIAYGILSEAEVALWLAVVGAVLVPGLAAANVRDDDE